MGMISHGELFHANIQSSTTNMQSKVVDWVITGGGIPANTGMTDFSRWSHWSNSGKRRPLKSLLVNTHSRRK